MPSALRAPARRLRNATILPTEPCSGTPPRSAPCDVSPLQALPGKPKTRDVGPTQLTATLHANEASPRQLPRVCETGISGKQVGSGPSHACRPSHRQVQPVPGTRDHAWTARCAESAGGVRSLASQLASMSTGLRHHEGRSSRPRSFSESAPEPTRTLRGGWSSFSAFAELQPQP